MGCGASADQQKKVVSQEGGAPAPAPAPEAAPTKPESSPAPDPAQPAMTEAGRENTKTSPATIPMSDTDLAIAFVNIDCVDGKQDAFIAASLANATESRKEKENKRFECLQSKEDPTKFVLVEIYETSQGPKDHKETAHYKAWREGVADMMATPRQGFQYLAHSPTNGNAFKAFWNSAPSNWPTSEAPLEFTVVHVRVKPGTEEAFTSASLENSKSSLQEPGNLRFDVLQERADTTHFVLVEVYQSASEAAKHKETAHYMKWRDTVADMMAEPRQGKKYTVCGDASPWLWATPKVRAPPKPALEVPAYPLNDGSKMPKLGFGCYKVGVIPGSATGGAGTAVLAPARQVIADALAAGYRCFDCAQFYENECEIGEALQESCVAREDLYLISKVWTNKIFEGADAVRTQLQKTIADLSCQYLDMYMIHWPVPGKHVDAYKAVLECQKEGLVKSVGVSNYTIEDLAELQAAGLPLPAVNQIEINPFLYRKKTIAHFQGLGIQLQAYRALCTFGKPASLADETVHAVASKHGRTTAQVLGRWSIQKGFQHIPKSEKRERMDENAKLFDFELDDDDLSKLDNLTTDANLQAFKSTYLKCVFRDTPMEGSQEGLKTDCTID
eukprot:gnl/TRDRNA2_/TRDRNA2_196976_c0_seq1.p1 gnl/TRDRNA2_/TRDRNA2_196976_c0~~gnl/TRDRNA2_/TRDRNA2_196976_c0_seq1.p1  ORF type:complete len:615 (+),score=114.43 gnl/TRDRNA2_/TRDRNA2_196976_c0_seq1:33-1877(+)